MERVTLPMLNAFVAAATHRSCTQAAHDLGLSTAGVSISIRRLERILGVILFRSRTKGMHLSREGEELLVRLCPVMDRLEEVLAEHASATYRASSAHRSIRRQMC
jgi:DNA-binding transcriptional LysR family regulator